MHDDGYYDTSYEDYLADVCSGERDPYTEPYWESRDSMYDTPCSDDDDESGYTRSYSYEEYREMNTYDLSNLVANIRYMAKQRGASIQEVEDAAGVSRGYFSRLKSSEASPSVKVVMAVADFLDIPADDLTFLTLPYDETEDDQTLEDFLTQLIEDTQENAIKWERISKEFFEGWNAVSKLSVKIGDGGTPGEEYYAYLPQGIYSFSTEGGYVTKVDAGEITIIIGCEKNKQPQASLVVTPMGSSAHEVACTAWLKEPLSDLLKSLVCEADESLSRLHVDRDVMSSIGAFIGGEEDDDTEIDAEELAWEDYEEEFEHGGDN